MKTPKRSARPTTGNRPGKLLSPTGKRQVLPPTRPNLGIAAAYRARLDKLIAEMHASVLYWVRAAYRRSPPALAADAAADELAADVRKLGDRWLKRFREASLELAKRFAHGAERHATSSFTAALEKAGMTVKFTMSPVVADVTAAAVKANVQLITTIPQQYLAQVQGEVMRSVQTGRDLETLTDFIEEQYGVTRRRAAFIARDQNEKATSAVARARQEEVGIEKAVWVHSHGGRVPRLEHVQFAHGTHPTQGGPVYEVKKGAYLEGRWTWPGYEINCRCVTRPIVEGLT